MVIQHILDGTKNGLVRINAMVCSGKSKVNEIATPGLITDELIAYDSKLIKGVDFGVDIVELKAHV